MSPRCVGVTIGATVAVGGDTGVTVPGLCRSMVLSWLLTPPDEESPSGGSDAAANLQREWG